MQSPGHDLFAGAGFTRNQDSHAGVRQSANRPEDILHHRGLPDQLQRPMSLFLIFLSFVSRGRGLLIRHRALHKLDRFIDVKGLRQIFKRPLLESGHRAFQIGKRRGNDHGKLRILFLDAREKIDAIGTRHPDIGDQHAGAVILQGGPGRISVRKRPAGEPRLCQHLFQNPADRAVIIHNPDFIHELFSLITLG